MNPPIFIKGTVVTQQGTVLENAFSSFPGQPMYLKVKNETDILRGSEIKVVYHSGKAPCAQEGMSIPLGAHVEVHGLAVADDTVTTCGSADYYLRVLSGTGEARKEGDAGD